MHLHALSVWSWLAASPLLCFYLSGFDAPAVPNNLLRIRFDIRRRVIFETSIFFLIRNHVPMGHTPARVQVRSRSTLSLSPVPRLRARVSFFYSSELSFHVRVNYNRCFFGLRFARATGPSFTLPFAPAAWCWGRLTHPFFHRCLDLTRCVRIFCHPSALSSIFGSHRA